MPQANPAASQFIGEFDCRLDDKGRIMLPASLRKQIAPQAQDKFIINRGFENCLSLYPFHTWQIISGEVNKLNMYVKKNREFVRYFYRGATELMMDNNGRLLLPKRLMEYAGISKDIILSAFADKMEVWDKNRFENLITDEPDEFALLAEEAMGRIENGNKGNVS
jgi:MraZ protein